MLTTTIAVVVATTRLSAIRPRSSRSRQNSRVPPVSRSRNGASEGVAMTGNRAAVTRMAETTKPTTVPTKRLL